MLAEDITAFFSRDDFATAVEISPYGSTVAKGVAAIFADAYATAGAGGMEVAGTGPNLMLATRDVPACWKDAHVSVLEGPGAGCYVAREHKPDGTGVSLLLLEKA